jgi:hypothetical protein
LVRELASVLLVMASAPYDPADYIRDHSEFLALVALQSRAFSNRRMSMKPGFRSTARPEGERREKNEEAA